MGKKSKKASAKSSNFGVSAQSNAESSKKEPQKHSSRAYAGAQTTNDLWHAASTSADSEILGALRPLRNRSRQMCRDNNEFKGAIRSWANNVVGTGIRLQSKVKRRRGDGFDENLNTAIEETWEDWSKAKYCHTGGKLSRADLERLCVKSLVESGEILIRLVKQSFDGSPVPLALELIESDQLCDDLGYMKYGDNEVRMGVEVDEWQRPVAYHFYPYHPGDLQFGQRRNKGSQLIRIPAEEIIHLYICDRPGQTRGVPWFHSALLSMRQTAGFTEAEVVKARGQANITGFIKSPDGDTFVDEVDPVDKKSKMVLSPGVIPRLAPGEEIQSFIPTSPGGNFEPFVRAMYRSAAIAIGLSYSTFTGDYSQTSFSSIRAEKLDERDCFKVIQSWFVSQLYDRLYPIWLDMAVLSGALNLPNYELNPKFYCKPRFMCRGWAWVNPLQDIKASQSAVSGGFSTLTQDAAERGLDIEDVFEERAKELQLAKQKGLNFNTTVEPPAVPVQPSDQAAQPAGDQGQGKSFGFWKTSSAESRSLEVSENSNPQTSADLEEDDPLEWDVDESSDRFIPTYGQSARKQLARDIATGKKNVLDWCAYDDGVEWIFDLENKKVRAILKEDDEIEEEEEELDEAIAAEEVMEVETSDPEEAIDPNPQTSSDLEVDDPVELVENLEDAIALVSLQMIADLNEAIEEEGDDDEDAIADQEPEEVMEVQESEDEDPEKEIEN
jgi:lambda family phage portal protein